MKQKVLFLLVIFSAATVFLNNSPHPVAAQSVKTTHKVCAGVRKDYARCFATVLTDQSGAQPMVTGSPQGYGPEDFRAAYGVSGTAKTHIGIVTAYDAPTIESDLATFSKTYGLPVLPSCADHPQSSCFEKLNQLGGASKYPARNSAWAVETSLDVESVHGMCPECSISLIEATSPSLANLAAAAVAAEGVGAKVISNSYGGSESSGETAYDKSYYKSGVTMVASSGDSGYGTNYPAASPYVVAVGGTTLTMNGRRVASETAWNGSGSGCSQYEHKPSWQHDPRCSMRSIADVSADADPLTGAAIYDSYPSSGKTGWFTVGGTSLAAPLVVGIIASSGVRPISQLIFTLRLRISFVTSLEAQTEAVQAICAQLG